MNVGKKLFIFWQFNGSNECYCQLHCPECYGRDVRTYKHYWNGEVLKWEEAFKKIDAQHGNYGIYFVFSYGEALVSKGFYECVDMISRHPTWTLNIISNLMASPERLVKSSLAMEKRLFMIPCWHPEGVNDQKESWEIFKQHLLILKNADVPTHVMMVWFDPVIKNFPYYFKWLDQHDFRVGVRRFVNDSFMKKVLSKIPMIHGLANDRYVLKKYSKAEKGYLYAYTCSWVTKYGLDLVSPKSKVCFAGKDMILVEHDGTVKPCASCTEIKHILGNIFDSNYKLNVDASRCPTHNCGGDFGFFVLPDTTVASFPDQLLDDTFISQVENVKQDSPVPYRNRIEMLKWIEELKCEKPQ